MTNLGYYYNIPDRKRGTNMNTDVKFKITYYAKKHGKHITRLAKWDSLSKYWTSKSGNQLITYYDLDAQGYRTCSGNYKIRF